jgi:formamidase
MGGSQKGGAGDCPYTYMHDLVSGRYRLPWEDSVQVTDGTVSGIAAPTRVYGEPTARAAE